MNRLLHEDRSFSGHERDCAFLNTGGERFADVSAVTGFDAPDDGRAMAIGDWDFDGDLDVWVANRTAPRLRFFRNDLAGDNHFLGVKLQGDGETTNRDAIGARVELHLGGDPARSMIRTVHAGDGFLTQSTRWIHFGLGAKATIDRLVVKWTDGRSQVFRDLKPDGQYLIDQASGKATPWHPPGGRRSFVPGQAPLLPPTSVARIILPQRLPLPRMSYQSWDDRNLPISEKAGPLLVNLWADWCPPCMGELSQWTRRAQEIRAKGVRVLALCTNGLDGRASASSPSPLEKLKRMSFAFESGRATQRLLNQLDVMQRAVLDRWQPMPLPTSFLIDADGKLAVIYKGPVSVDQLLADVDLLGAALPKVADAATPFPGRWYDMPSRVSPMLVASQFIDRAQIDEAVEYLTDVVNGYAAAEDGVEANRSEIVTFQTTIALLLADEGKTDKAVAVLQGAERMIPHEPKLTMEIGHILFKADRLAEAALVFEQVMAKHSGHVDAIQAVGQIRIRQARYQDAIDVLILAERLIPRSASLKFDLAAAYQGVGNRGSAVAKYREAIALDPHHARAIQSLAWLLATDSKDDARNGREAVELAELLVKLTGLDNPTSLDTLAAAYAEVGQFDRAIATVTRAIQFAQEQQKGKSVSEYQHRLRLYENKAAYRH